MTEVTREHLAGLELFKSIHKNDIDYLIGEELDRLIAQASAAPEQDPVAWVIDWPEEPELGHYFSDESNPTARSRPLYTHSDPSEVVRLAELVATGNDLLNAATQRADAAERKLRERYATEDWGIFAGYLIDKCEGHEVAEENLQFWFRDMLDDPHYGALFRREKMPCEMPSAIEMAIEAAEEEHGSLRSAAKALGIDHGYLCRLKNGDKVNPSNEVLAALGLERAVIYRPLLSASAEPASPKCTTCSDVGVIGHSTMCPDCEPAKGGDGEVQS